MDSSENRNRKIIDAILRKEQTVCPGAVALIGIYGSFQTGDVHPLSDLDLLILINDDRGWQLGKAFIQEDVGVGHDIYCTNWESLRQDAEHIHPHISKLMDSQIVYCADEKYREELETLREQVRRKLAEPLGEEDYRRAEKELREARCCYADAMTAEALSEVRRNAGGTIYFTENAVALLNKIYFRKGVSRRYEELEAMDRKPDNLCDRIEKVLSAETVEGLKEQLTLLMKDLTSCFLQAKRLLPEEKKPAGADTLSGTYEEMFSNWHGKMVQAA
ncbi:MAG: nucleotidyltransferase domain-containing protein, partial [Clostridia bacterium]|nr:nucleotidyltransferase domain-containing protein [Clostridia bacterium]